MEKTKVQSLLIVFLVLGLLSMQPVAASFKRCYRHCIKGCIFTGIINPAQCVLSCLGQCIGYHNDNTSLTSNDFCNVGCVSSLCSNLMTKENLQKLGGKEEVEGCLDSCSTSYCAKN
ncbi:hypothetical protein Patl1_34099 [Pistacia atlantica]|uniref:Uncharacterized protein n=2 Tax=Pistacia atlantica TaxID=434234 RepID=A0ACC0ZU21_9ROSI|nr:hypothetical protein Patl1_34104 [Pistacia atlantica]KAJ0075713.1 hypothetical protein Patl1_34099 [Pistacia atlantica]